MVFEKIYNFLNSLKTYYSNDFSPELLNKFKKCIDNPELYSEYFLNITEITKQNLIKINNESPDRSALSFIQGYKKTITEMDNIIKTYFEINSCGIYQDNLYVIKKINYEENLIDVKIMEWGKKEDVFDIKDETISFSNFLFSKEDTDINLLLKKEKIN